nr:putative nucleotidyltransferase, ribonuclease H [Tanacetum cinerariifolium]
MLRSCALEWTGNWDDYICLVEFAYNNSWHASIKCAPFEMLYGRKCRAPICWDHVRERVIEGPEMIEVTNAKVAVAKEKLKEARTRQKSYTDKHRRELEFQPDDNIISGLPPSSAITPDEPVLSPDELDNSLKGRYKDQHESFFELVRSLFFVLEMRNNVTPPDTYSVQAPFRGVTESSDFFEESV